MNYEEELQQKIEEGKLQELEKNDLDVRAYASIFKTLQNAPQYVAPPDLADLVLKKLPAKRKRSLLQNDFFWLAAGIAILFGAAVFIAIRINYVVDLGFLNGMSAYKGLIIFGLGFIVFINFLDRQLVKNNKSSV